CIAYQFPVRMATGSDWAFVPAVKNYTPLLSSQAFNFLGVLYGDVSGNWQPGLLLDAPGNTDSAGVPLQLAGTAVATSQAQATDSNTTDTAEAVRPAAVLYLAVGPKHNQDGSWTVVLGLQHADGILGLDMDLHYDSSAIQVTGIAGTGIGSSLAAVSAN